MYLNNKHFVARTVTLLGPAQTSTSSSSSFTITSSATSTSSADTTPTVYPHSHVVGTSAATPTTAASSKAADTSASSGVKKGPIIGGVIGGVIFVSLVAFAVWFFLRRRKMRKMQMVNSFDRGITPMLRSSNGNEKFAMDESPDLAYIATERLTGGGVFGPFGGYQRTASRELLHESRSLGIHDDNDITDARIKDPEKEALKKSAPPVSEHPAHHPLPGHTANIPTYYPGGAAHPIYTRSSLPSQRSRKHASTLPSQYPTQTIRAPFAQPVAQGFGSPQIPDFVFSPIELVPGVAALDEVPITPQAELAAFPSPPTTIPSHLSNIANSLKRQMTPPRKANHPRRQSTPPRNSAPLGRLTPPHISTGPTSVPAPSSAPLIQRGTNPMKSFTGLQISGLQRKPTGRPAGSRPRGTTYPSPTAGGRPELPASTPSRSSIIASKSVLKTPKHMISTKQPMPAFNHISLPSPSSPASSTLGRNESTNTTYSIPIAFDPKSRRQSKAQPSDWPLTNHPVTSDRHHLREQPSAISALSEARDLHNASAVSALSVLSPTSATTPGGGNLTTPGGSRLSHNHSREFLSASSPHQHVMSWQDYDGNAQPGHHHSRSSNEMGMDQRLLGETEVSPMFSPPIDHGNSIVSPMTMGMKTPGIGAYGAQYGYGVVSPMTMSAKTPSQASLDEREREREEYFGDLSVQPLNMGQRIMGRWSTKKKGGARRSY